MTARADRIRNRRQRFAAPGSALDRIVRVLAVVLPAGVGVIAAMMLITPLGPKGEVSFLLDRDKVPTAKDRLRVDNAMYRGSDNRGRPFSLVAGEAVQRTNAVPLVEMEDLTARILLSEGPAVLSTRAGEYDIDDERVSVPGIIRFEAADGYSLSARNVTLDLVDTLLVGDGRVYGTIPAGRFSANTMRVDLAERTITLAGQARMTMVPGRLQMPGGL
ncbi:LPS export ABC transporter periplasmic protein LptC [Aurantiacibacter spongiae]|uniref:LPS export ABC transporter periplasmic protein LptC n=1 Tax=Aurantiacibacter spongiae TaxID=2488860 RepID=A0A3N5DQZ0_9SPHN|nr:LPS export ABC transporter periplasmic protein LptC [Aurantiacibacter spongiae]RPF71541.1 LPS export ABC transporter periplasmic protein LptC [Aurantiacibacter spongiae]